MGALLVAPSSLLRTIINCAVYSSDIPGME
mgnify:CR=1 FL=1|jgi:hypothetical protein